MPARKKLAADETASRPAAWLFKEEPDHYSFADLEKDGETLWTGVSNPLARRNLRQLEVGDRVLYYHTGKERAIVGEMTVVAGPQADPAQGDAKAVVVKVKPLRRWPVPVTLEQIKADPRFAQWELVRLPRLSVMPVSAEQLRWLESIANASGKRR
jgi:predicted RNA-binding protein with PUA-like domain